MLSHPKLFYSMQQVYFITLKALRRIYTQIIQKKMAPKPTCEQNPDKVSQIIYEKLVDNKPCMIARFGANELYTLVNFLGVKYHQKKYWKFIKGESPKWWWDTKHQINNLHYVAGFFPPSRVKIEQFCELMLEDVKEVDVLGSWLANENYFQEELKSAIYVKREVMNPFFTNTPWTKALKNKKVLVIHPFAKLIESQYQNSRNFLFKNPHILPDFNLKTIEAVQSHGGETEKFKDWFEALNWMKNEIDKRDFDICLVGCGAYGFHLAAHIKRRGKKVVHLGGALQLLFGIKGKRWEDPNYNTVYNYAELMNKYWVRPGEQFKPSNADKVEGACYW